MDLIKQDIIGFAKDLGFKEVKIARVEALSQEFEYYKDWIKKGFHADMKYLEKGTDEKEFPNLFFPSAKSIIALAMPYYQEYCINWVNEFKIARYALGKDYHNVVGNKLQEIINYIYEKYNALSKFSVDSTPLMEKAIAARAGIGWQGKNSLIISPTLGSFFFLGLIFTELDLQKDNPISNNCGECARCITACPSGAIASEKTIDCNKCLAYWTIEAKDFAPQEIIEVNKDNWLFGCDICQNVCPYNSKLNTEDLIEEFKESSTIRELNLEQIINLDSESFNKLFADSPIKRAKARKFKYYAEIIRSSNY